ncbi:MAG: glycosyltransferase family 4 protein [Planctomycetes bacterium]|nr:glycosyltransferase family 4 protein [Planctomycetota bacterium]
MTPLRIAVVNGDPGIAYGGAKGAALHLSGMVRALERCGCDVHVTTLRAERGSSPAFVASCPEPMASIVRWLKESEPSRAVLEAAELAAIGANIPVLAHLTERHALQPFDLVYERLSLFGTAGSRFCAKYQVPHFLEVNAPLVDEQKRFRGLAHEDLARAIERQLLSGAQQVLAVSPALARHAVALGAASERVQVQPNGAEAQWFHRGVDGSHVRASLGFCDTDVVVGFIGGLRPWHGIEHLFAGFDRARRSNSSLRLLLVGDGPLSPMAQERAEKSGGVVVWRPAVAHREVPALLAACDLLTATYAADAAPYFSPLKIAEAMLVGRPMIASRIEGIGPLLRHGETGWLVEPGDDAAFASALELLASDAPLRAAIGARAAEDARSRLTWDAIARRTLALAGLSNAQVPA